MNRPPIDPFSSGGNGSVLINCPATDRSGGSAGIVARSHSAFQPVAETTYRGSTRPALVSTLVTRPPRCASDCAPTPHEIFAPLLLDARASESAAFTGCTCASEG